MAQAGLGQRSRCFFQRSVMGTPPKGRSQYLDDRALFDEGATTTSRTPRVLDDLFDGELSDRTTPRVGEDAHVFQSDEVGNDLGRIDEHRGVEESFSFSQNKAEAPLCLRETDARRVLTHPGVTTPRRLDPW